MPIDPNRVAARLGKRIAALRHDRGLSQGKLAGEVRTSAQWIAQLERGTRSPTLHMLCLLANALGVTLPDLLLDAVELERVANAKCSSNSLPNLRAFSK